MNSRTALKASVPPSILLFELRVPPRLHTDLRNLHRQHPMAILIVALMVLVGAVVVPVQIV
jgi:hypothetical protein